MTRDFCGRRDAAEKRRFVDPGEQSLVGQGRDLRTGQRSGDVEAELAADMPGDLLIVAGHHFQGDAQVGEGGQRLTRPRLRRVKEGQESREGQVFLVGDVRLLAVCLDLPPRDPQDAVAVGAEPVERRLGGFARRGVEGARRRSLLLITGRVAEDVFRRALHDEETPASAFDENRNPAPLEVERHLVDLAPGREVDLAGRENRFVQGTLEPGLERGVELRHLHHRAAVLPAKVHFPDQLDAGFGQRSGLVAAKHVHGAEIVDGGLALDDHLLARQADRAMGERDRHDHRQEFRRQSDGERQREQEGFEQRSMEQDVDEDHEQDKKDRGLYDHHPEILDADRKGGRRRRLLQRAGDRAELGLAPGRQDQRLGGSADHRASHEHKIGRERARPRRAGRRRRVLFGRVRLAGEKRFVDVEVAGFDQSGVGGHEIAGGEKNDIAGHDLSRGNVDRLSIAKRLGGKRDLLAQALGGVLGLALLHHVEDHRHQHDGRDDDEARNVAGERRDRRREKQNQDQRIAEPSKESRPAGSCVWPRRSGSVRPSRGWPRRRTRSSRSVECSR